MICSHRHCMLRAQVCPMTREQSFRLQASIQKGQADGPMLADTMRYTSGQIFYIESFFIPKSLDFWYLLYKKQIWNSHNFVRSWVHLPSLGRLWAFQMDKLHLICVTDVYNPCLKCDNTHSWELYFLLSRRVNHKRNVHFVVIKHFFLHLVNNKNSSPSIFPSRVGIATIQIRKLRPREAR